MALRRNAAIAVAVPVVLAGALLARGTLAPSAPPARAVVWAVGDGADGSPESKALARRIAAGHPTRFLYLGDVYGNGGLGDGTAAAFAENFDDVYGPLVARTAPTPGNHEWPARRDGYYPYWHQVKGRTQPDYYAFRLAGWEILSLNSEGPHGTGSPQERWLRSQLREPGTCRLAFWHRPRFSAGRHGDQPDVAPLWDPLRGHAAIVVTGHDHDLQRLKSVDGITEFVVGAGGESRYGLHRDGRVAFGDDRTGAALRLELTPGQASFAFVAADGRRLDGGRVRCAELEG